MELLSQRYDEVKSYQQAMLDAAASERLAHAGRERQPATEGLLASLHHAADRLWAAHLGHVHGPQRRRPQPIH